MGHTRKITRTRLAPDLSRAYVLRKTHMPAWFKTGTKSFLLLPRRYSKTPEFTLQTLRPLLPQPPRSPPNGALDKINYHKLLALSLPWSGAAGQLPAQRGPRATGICSASKTAVRTPAPSLRSAIPGDCPIRATVSQSFTDTFDQATWHVGS